MKINKIMMSACGAALLLNSGLFNAGAIAAEPAQNNAVQTVADTANKKIRKVVDDKRRIADLKKMGSRKPDGQPATVADMEAAIAALNASYNGVAIIKAEKIDEKRGGAIARNVVISTLDETTGVTFESVKLWGLNAEAINRLGELSDGDAVKILSHMRAEGVSTFGLAEAYQKSTETMTKTIVDAVGDAAGPDVELTDDDISIDIGQYDFTMAKMVVDGLTIFGGPAPTTDESVAPDPFISAMSIGAAQMHAVSIDAMAGFDTKMTMSYDQPTGKSSVVADMPFYAMTDFNRGDYDYLVATDFDMVIAAEVQPEPAETPVDGAPASAPGEPINLDMTIGYDLIAMENLKFANLYAALVQGRFPAMTETDAASWGVFRMKGERQMINGAPLVTVDEAVMDLSEGHWLIPSNITWRTTGAKYHVAAFLERMGALAAESAPADADAASAEEIEQIVQILRDSGFETVSFDSNAVMNWDPKTGAVAGNTVFDIADFGDLTVEMTGEVPTYEKITAVAPSTINGEWDALGALFVNDGALVNYKTTLEDAGGIEKVFTLISGFAALAPEGDPTTAAFRGSTPAEARVAISTMMRVMGPSIASIYPPATAYIANTADFIADGGALSVSVAPETPISVTSFAAASAAMEAGDPTALINLLGLVVDHAPAKN